MKKRRLWIRSSILFVMVLAIGYTFYNHFSEDRGLVDAGDFAPNFVLEDLDGNRLELSDLQGQGVYVNFWATYCTYCRDKMGYLQEVHDEYAEKGVQIVNINVDETTLQVERHKQRYGLDYPLYIDRNMLVGNAYGVAVLPSVFLIDETGEVVEHEVGGKTREHVLASLDDLVPSSN
ncbi:thiol-disulfide oxidoreductase ResA [Paenalkalicoccus suaedae]|uniref:Thiol-disulfide oxidoreductase ResA n=1 Tax=Paenalkalicoccus suaedae TaxID=2592382 RepID=A0A859FCU4_9BACI|nr:thiol-disulfide oxidoreductase ResA [Paenalkalicoccus suaedae]QKS71049.1 thiol-disulfide oxidoreductase ResA [Paenalkalicoccus suaedae]